MRCGFGRLAMAALAFACTSLGQGAVAQTRIQYTYDALGHVTAAAYSTGAGVTYAYDAAGNRSQQTSAASAPAPTAGPVSTSTAYNTAAAITLAPSGIYTSLAIVSNPSHGSVTISGSTATYTPISGYSGSDGFTYKVTGPGGESAPAAVTITVAPPAAPTVSAKAISTAYNTAGAVNLAPSGVYTSVAVATPPTKGAVSISGTTATYTPNAGSYGSDSFTFTATGPGGTSAPATASVTVALPAAPTVSAKAISTAYNTAGSVNLAPSGVYTSVAVATAPTKGAVSISGTTATYTPNDGTYGADSFTYNAVGIGGTSGTAAVTVSVAAPAPPTVSNTSLTASYNGSGSVVLPVGGLYSSIGFPGGSPVHGVLSLTGATVTYIPTAGYYGADSFTYNATGLGGTSATATVYVTVPRPPPPTAGNIAVDTLWGTSAVFNVPVSGYYDSITIPNLPPLGGVGISGSTVTYTGIPGHVGPESFIYTASGPGGVSAPGTITVTVVAPPPPTAGDVSANVPYNTATNITLPITGTIYSINIMPGPAHGTATTHGSIVTYLPNSGYSGPDSFQYAVSNGTSGSNLATVSINVAAPPATPQPTPQPDVGWEVYSRNTVVITPLDNDSDPSGYPLTITAVSSNGGGSPNIINGGTQISYQAPAVATRFNKIVTLTYTVSNGHGGVASSTIQVTVDTEYWDTALKAPIEADVAVAPDTATPQ